MITIRPFRNFDVPIVCQLWNGHRAAAGIDGKLSSLSLEVAVLGRPFFDPQNLLIASEEQQPLGFLHWMPAAEGPGEAVVANLSVPLSRRRDEVAAALIAAASEAAAAQGAARLLIGQAPEHWTGYAGIAVHGLGGGVPQWDTDVTRWAAEAGFSAIRQLLNYRLDTLTYRPSYDRELIGLRRSVSVDHRMEVTDLPFRCASALSHLQLHRFIARRPGGESVAEADLMLGDPEMLVVTSGVAMLTRWSAQAPDRAIERGSAQAPVPGSVQTPVRGSALGSTAVRAGVGDRPSPALRFVLASALASLLAERVSHIEATLDSTDTLSTALLQQSGFKLDHRGTVFAKSL